MENLKRVIELLFKRIEPSAVLNGEIHPYKITAQDFVPLSSAYSNRYSETEYENLYRYYRDYLAVENEKQGFRQNPSEVSAFDGLFYYVKQILTFQNNEVVCRYTHLEQWRKLTFELSEDLLVSSFYASRFIPEEMESQGFTWKTVIGHNNIHLNHILEKGLAENHFHLYGSAPMFHISWISLMNNPSSSTASRQLWRYDQNRRNISRRYNAALRENPLSQKVRQAALIRLYLFAKAQNLSISIGEYNVRPADLQDLLLIPNLQFVVPEQFCVNTFDYLRFYASIMDALRKEGTPLKRIEMERIYSVLDLCKAACCPNEKGEFPLCGKTVSLSEFVRSLLPFVDCVPLASLRPLLDANVYHDLWARRTGENVRYFLNNPDTLELYMSQVQEAVDLLRFPYDSMDPRTELEDYTLSALTGVSNGGRPYNSLFAGERKFLYSALYNIRHHEMPYEDMDLFYAYLIIKETLRGELIQSNDNVGFHNFQQYEKRKKELIYDSIFNNAFVRHAVRENLLTEHMKLLEIRVSPGESSLENAQYIQQLDDIILGGEKDPQKRNAEKDRFFYTFHFIKKNDQFREEDECLHCRHYELREKLLQKTSAIARFREDYPEQAIRVRGIDAASQEIGCRPEVFATSFRFLSRHVVHDPFRLYHRQLPQLRITYHVGEDFLDIADGLRAIDEAIYFLGIDCGDRLGHALALGIDADQWYQSKGNKIVLPKQDYMDNLVWMHERITQSNLPGQEQLKSWIEKEYDLLFHEIYANNIDLDEVRKILRTATEEYRRKRLPHQYSNQDISFDIHHYYQSWRLRGDDPELYRDGYFSWEDNGLLYESSRIGGITPEKMSIRFIPEVFLLYYYYHYNKEVRKKGNETIEVTAKPFYIEGVKILQKDMQRRIAKRGIGVETNPSSNYLIGTFKNYAEHPIFKFYNKGLTYDPEELRECAQISASVNTDDKGVFSTSLENEYSLLAFAKEHELSTDGTVKYPRSMVYEWLNDVRKMGISQSFGDVKHASQE